MVNTNQLTLAIGFIVYLSVYQFVYLHTYQSTCYFWTGLFNVRKAVLKKW